MLIDYQHVNVYQENTCVLKDVAFHVDEGEFVYIIGKVGSGKSSLLKTFYCELDLYKEKEKETKAEVLDRDLYKIKRKEVPSLRKEMGIIFQDFQLLHDRTIRKNLEFVLRATGWKNKKEITQRIEEVLGEVGLMEKLDKMPHELSGGEQQRIAIALAEPAQNNHSGRAYRQLGYRNRPSYRAVAERYHPNRHRRGDDHPQPRLARSIPWYRLSVQGKRDFRRDQGLQPR